LSSFELICINQKYLFISYKKGGFRFGSGILNYETKGEELTWSVIWTVERIFRQAIWFGNQVFPPNHKKLILNMVCILMKNYNTTAI